VTLTVAELRELAALKLPLVKARGRWAALRPEDVDAALAFFARREERGEASAGELLRAGLGVDAAHAGLAGGGDRGRRVAARAHVRQR
jgi:hypothetical protein